VRRRGIATPVLPAALSALLVVAAAGARPAGASPAATTCPVIAGGEPGLAPIDAGARLAWIEQRLTATAGRARLWVWSWGLGVGASGVASLVAVPFVAPGERVDWYTSAGSAAVGVIPFVLLPPEVIRDARELHAEREAARRAPGPGPGNDDVCALLARAEGQLLRDAEDQRRNRSWWFHAGNLAFNTGITLFLGLGFHHWGAGLINGVAGAVVGEAIIFTQPSASIDDLHAYRAGQLGWSYAGAF
jgi:hypothetical protein